MLHLSTLRTSTALSCTLSHNHRRLVATRAMPSTPETCQTEKNVLGGLLECCCKSPKTGFFRDGFCRTGPQDRGVHIVCSEVNEKFLNFTKSRGNDLSTPMPMYNFPGLKAGDRWCLCVSRWIEAKDAGAAPGVVLKSTHESALKHISLAELQEFAIDLQEKRK